MGKQTINLDEIENIDSLYEIKDKQGNSKAAL